MSCKDSLVFHRKQSHENKREDVCEICGQKFTSRGNLNKHIQYIHNRKENEVECEICKKKYANSIYLKANIDNVHERKNAKSCSICGDNFVSRFGYANHMLSIHKTVVVNA